MNHEPEPQALAETMDFSPDETLVEAMQRIQAMPMHTDTKALVHAAIKAQTKGTP